MKQHDARVQRQHDAQVQRQHDARVERQHDVMATLFLATTSYNIPYISRYKKNGSHKIPKGGGGPSQHTVCTHHR